jgi:hypothetical protein
VPIELLKLHANGFAVRYFVNEDGSPYLCGGDFVAATNLGDKLNPTNIRRRVGDLATVRVDRRDHVSHFGTKGRPDILFFEFDALERWARRHPDGPADKLIKGLRITHFRIFDPVDD